ncbi:sulfurtransferase TusA family protein [Paracoccus marcusii]|uniref:sulfurtransferase TusA family protein n=1 Tax=Paracoccus TaxID=265 RepID=UPI0005DD1E54|nr:preprotein translocase subunit TatB [Paracoccus sp. 228]
MTDLDARGLLCPLPVLRLRKQLLAIPEGGIVRLIATDDMAMVDVPHFCGQAGHAMIGMRDLGDGVTEFTVRRGPATGQAADPAPEES